MTDAILNLPISAPALAGIRALAREVADSVGLDNLQQTRFCTAVSEIARNAVQYAHGGGILFTVREFEGRPGQWLVAEISDHGPGLHDPATVLQGERARGSRLPMGISGSTRLVDRILFTAPPGGGTAVSLEMALPQARPRLAPAELARLAAAFARPKQKSPQEELERQNRELLQAMNALREKSIELERADERKNQFVTTLAHELRNPLATLEMTLELMRRKVSMDPQELAHRREVMSRQTAQLTKLVEDLMDVARVSQGKVELNRQPLELNTLISQSVEMTGGAIAAKAHAVSLDMHADPLWVSADALRLKQVVCNLIQNSARYTPPNGAIGIQVRRERDEGVIEVRDNGIGIAPEVLPHIFGMFVQGGAAPAGAEGGLGLGLTLVHHLVREHGGTVVAASEGIDRGSRFIVTLPLVAAPATPE